MTGHGRRPRAIRLVFAFDDEGIRLVGSTPRRKAAPRGIDPRGPSPDDAITVAVRTDEGYVRHRQVLFDPIPQSLEFFDDGVPRRTSHAPSQGAFSAVVPAVEGRTAVVVEAGPEVRLQQPAFAAPEAAHPGRRELARFVLGER